MSTNLSDLLYLIPIVTFILALRYLSNPAHARRGNQIGAAGMLVAIVVTWVKAGHTSWWALVIGMLIGGGFVVTDRMLEMFKSREPAKKVDASRNGSGSAGAGAE